MRSLQHVTLAKKKCRQLNKGIISNRSLLKVKKINNCYSFYLTVKRFCFSFNRHFCNRNAYIAKFKSLIYRMIGKNTNITKLFYIQFGIRIPTKQVFQT